MSINAPDLHVLAVYVLYNKLLLQDNCQVNFMLKVDFW